MKLYDQTDATVSPNNNPRGHFAGCVLRLAGHDFMDYRKDSSGKVSGGSDGCVNFLDPDNAGLLDCIVNNKLQTAYEPLCSVVSLADFVVIAAEAMMARTATSYNSANIFASGTLAATFLANFQYGRITST